LLSSLQGLESADLPHNIDMKKPLARGPPHTLGGVGRSGEMYRDIFIRQDNNFVGAGFKTATHECIAIYIMISGDRMGVVIPGF
jgi:hypothetical protein